MWISPLNKRNGNGLASHAIELKLLDTHCGISYQWKPSSTKMLPGKKEKSDHLERGRLYVINYTLFIIDSSIDSKTWVGGQSKIIYIVIQKYFELSVLYLPFRYNIHKVNPPESAQILCPVDPLGITLRTVPAKIKYWTKEKTVWDNQTIAPTQKSNRLESESDSWK